MAKPSHRRDRTHHRSTKQHGDSRKGKSKQHPQFEDGLPSPKPHRYHAKELSILLQQQANRIDFSQLSSRVQNTLRKEVPRDCSDSRGKTHALMAVWFSIFDEIFFFSQLSKVVTGGIILYDKPEQDCDGLFDPKTRRIEIDMNAHREGVYSEQHQICVLLHEMVHAFLDIFSCHKRCCRKKLQKPDWGIRMGGHGSVWCNSMVFIEAAFRRLVRWPVSCSIPKSVALEMISEWQPREEQLVRWGLSLAALMRVRDSKGCSVCVSGHEWEDEDGDHVDEEYGDDEEDDGWEYVLCCTIM